MSNDDRRDQQRRIWDALAGGWERRRDFLADQSRLVSTWMVEHLDPRRGEVILELAAGNGETGFLTTALLGDTGLLLITDLSTAMLETARRAARDRGLRNVEFRLADLQDIPLDDCSVDGILCRWGYQQAPDPRRAFREAHRVLRPRRRLAMSVWAGDARNPLEAAVSAALAPFDPPPATPTPHYSPPVPTLETAEDVGSILCEADFVDVLVQEVPLSWELADDDDLWGFVCDLYGGAAVRIAELDESERAAVRANLTSSLARYATEAGYEIPALCLNAIATRP